MNPAIIRAENLTFAYSESDRTVIDSITLSVAEGEILCIVGPSGCGKSTLLRCLASLLGPTGGTVVFRGTPVRKPGPERFVVFQETDQLLPWRTALGNVEFVLERGRRSTAAAFLDIVGLSTGRDAYPHQLSGGMRQRVALARALAAGGEVLLLDEPFGSLDAITRERLQDVLLEMRETTGKTFLCVTHDLREAAYLGDRVLVMDSQGSTATDICPGSPRPRTRESASLTRDVADLRAALEETTESAG